MTELVRRGIYALPAAGVLTAIPWLFISKPLSLASSASILGNPSIKADPEGYARNLTSTGYVASSYLYLAGLICLMFGVLALYAYLVRSRASSWAAGGMIVSVVGIALALPIVGIKLMADTVLADVYLAGTKDVSPAMGLLTDKTLSYGTTSYFVVFLVISLIGAIGYAVAVWRSGSLPKWAGVLVAAGFVLSMTFTPGLAWVGALCLIIGGLWLARSVTQAPCAV